ncbi:MAG: hypothetical protein PHR35_00385 [Kiritimatiellae bacterium]|nr:hypothetical protein [Kiritimatiellia bacterium]
MKTRMVAATGAALMAALAVSAGTNDAIIYSNGFERPGDALSLLSLPNIAGDAFKIATETGIAPTSGLEGSGAFFFRADLLKDGFFYPNFLFPEPVTLPSGPVYLSAWFKFAEQDPETSHGPGLGIFLLCGNNSRLVGWTNIAQRADSNDGWHYLYTTDLSGVLTDRIARGFMARILNGVAGETVCLLIDDVRLSRTNPVPVPTEAEYQAKRQSYDDIRREWSAGAAGRRGDPLCDRIDDRLRKLPGLLGRNPQDRAFFVGEVNLLEQDYWRWRVLRLNE